MPTWNVNMDNCIKEFINIPNTNMREAHKHDRIVADCYKSIEAKCHGDELTMANVITSLISAFGCKMCNKMDCSDRHAAENYQSILSEFSNVVPELIDKNIKVNLEKASRVNGLPAINVPRQPALQLAQV